MSYKRMFDNHPLLSGIQTRGLYCKKDVLTMSQIRMAKELFGHMILFVIGVVVGGVSLATLSVAATAVPILEKIKRLVIGVIEGAIAAWLIYKSYQITVNNGESRGRLIVYDVCWTCLPPYNI